MFAQQVAALQSGERDPDDFKRFRLENGVYGIRDTTDQHMIRVKIRFGALSAEQLEALADIAEQFTPTQQGHITTRQDVQFHHIALAEVPTVLRRLADCELTTREACGNTVRNVTCCPFAGIASDEPFDVTPYADAVSSFFLRNPLNQNLPRKFKIAFEGCTTDHAKVAIHDLGIVAQLRDGRRGFQLYVAGGLGPIPLSAQLLEDFTPEDQLFPSIEAGLRIFDRHGNRMDRNRARLKFVLKDWGLEKFRELWLAERKIALLTRSGRNDWRVPITEEGPPPPPDTAPQPAPQTPAYARWRVTNCFAQKQAGHFGVHVRCPLGDLTHGQMRAVAAVARRFCGGRMRTTITQNLLLRWMHESDLPAVYRELDADGLALHEADHVADITRCPGADTCQLGITHSRGLAAALDELFQNGLASDPALQHLSIKISGCPNSCGQHHLADLGFYGNARTLDGHQVAHYRLLLGGGTTLREASFGEAIMAVPAKRVPDAVRKILLHYRDARQNSESFQAFAQRLGAEHFKQFLAEFAELPRYAERPDLYGDLGFEGEFKVKLGKGECAA